ncbi:Cell division protein FtsW [Actinomyces bovis]|uniref:Probable peptidoglycan glycosyltransferase FtsW n=1 Tax=Actinomyces bovis TaxID=1658 RepID=A0ABY1VQL6_9ACTO|nr:FtsW/RodA/SpoVE family cell cycle protein [Actinomyces bovis]SPT53931.1 Cell division protein FtsW [Actinomyces bovis]VEG53427.1 Cell division protein FtsW [Actinomyces israelii]
MAKPGERKWLVRRGRTAADGPKPGESAVLSYYGLGLTALLLLTIGLVMVFSVLSVGLAAEGSGIAKDIYFYALFPVVGIIGAFMISRLPVRFLKRSWYLVFPAGLIAQVATLFVGKEVNGNKNWLEIPLIGAVQPSEFLKIGLVLALGAIVERFHDRLSEPKVLLWAIGLPVGLSAGLVMGGGDLGTVIVLVLIVAGALWVGGLAKRWFVAALFVGVFLFALGSLSSLSRRNRILDWLGMPTPDYLDAGYQPRHALWAIATGRWTGVGLGQSRQKWGYLTQAESDYIYAILCEELGLIGGLLVLLLFLAFGYFCMRIMRRSQDIFTSVTVGAIACWVVGQALINISVVVRVLPVLGVPLPFISRGGSSLIAVLLAVGVLLCLARNEPEAQAALAVRGGAVRRTLAVITPRRRNHDRS